MSYRIFFFSLLLVSFTGCSHFNSGRSYLSEMENDDSTFFSPNDDFPIVAGDTGRDWNTEKEQLARTPASEADVTQSRQNRFLIVELRQLEGSQSDENLKLYEKHRKQLTTISEKIFFLQLPAFERRDYLMSRGFISERAPVKTPIRPENMPTLNKYDIALGMTKQDVEVSMGKPSRVEVAGNPGHENERWLYNLNGASKFVYFEAGHVQGWE